MHTLSTLKNGVRLVVAPSRGTEAASVLVLVKVGSRYESRKLSGAAHFIEHMMFKGTKRYPTSLDLSRTLEQYGADYNAYTTKEQTGYYVKIAGAKLDIGIELVHDMLVNSKFAPAEMERERGVIIEEIHMYADNPRMHLPDLLEAALFGDTALGWDTAGDTKSMRSMTRAEVLQYRKTHYVPERTVVVLSGAVSDKHIELTKKLFGSIASSKSVTEYEPARSFVPHATPVVKRQEKDTGQIQLAVGFPGKPMHSEDIPAQRLMTSILGGGMSSRLFVAVREKKGLAYSVGMSGASFEDTGYTAVTAGLAKNEYAKAVAIIMKELEKFKRSGPTDAELAEAKTQAEGRTLLALEDSSERAEWYANQVLFKGKAEDPDERLKTFFAVTKEDIRRVAREAFDRSLMSIAAIGPFGSDADVLKSFN